MRDDGLGRAGWGPLRWPWERCWIRRAEEVVDRELARWTDPPGPDPDTAEVGTAELAPDDPVAEGAENS